MGKWDSGAYITTHGPCALLCARLGIKSSVLNLLLSPSPHLSATFEQDVSGASTSGLGDCTGKLRN